ncbi:ABC transporter B family member 7, putative [Hepatocystis sp. ex Piliocolobus tephrosceles]|nr:ABC transporter B family member 7, putative [Hepatocystis sp. ex Piliocolobus tephrosceles]
MLIKRSIFNFCIFSNSRFFFSTNLTKLNTYKNRSNFIYSSVNNINYAKLGRKSNLFGFNNTFVSHLNKLKFYNYEKNRESLKTVLGITHGNRTKITIKCSKKKVRLFSTKESKYNSKDSNSNTKNSNKKSEGAYESDDRQDGSYKDTCKSGDNGNVKKISIFTNIIKKYKDMFEKKLNINFESTSIKDIYNILKKEKKYLALAMSCLLLSSIGQMFFPVFISKIINMYGGKEESLKYILNEVYKTVFLILTISTFSFLRIYLIETSIEKITRRLRQSLFEKILNQNINFFNKQKSGELINRLSTDIEISSKILIHLSFCIRNMIATLIGGICALHISPSKLFNSFLLPVSASLLIGTTYGKFIKRVSIIKQEKLSNSIDFAYEKINNITNVRLLNGESYEKKNFTKYLDEIYKTGKKYSLIKAGNHFLFFSIISLFLLHLIYYGNYLIVNNLINTGDLFSLIMYSLFCGSGIQGVMQSIGDIQKCIGACSKVLQIIHMPKSEMNEYWSMDSINFLKSKNYGIRFDNVSYSYDSSISAQSDQNTIDKSNDNKTGDNNSSGSNILSSDKSADTQSNNNEQHYALKNVSFYLPHNKSVAIVGKSGSGKTTILNLLSKKNNVTLGKIYIGEYPIDKINSSVLLSVLGVVTQDPFLFNCSLKSNLTYPYKAYEELLKEQIYLIEKKKKMTQQCGSSSSSDNSSSGNNNFIHSDIQKSTEDINEILTYLKKEIEHTKNKLDNSTEKLKDIYKDFHIDDFLINYSNYDNVSVGANGNFLSGGQKQRVYLAQNLYKNNKILILDEPTSSLDKISEKIVNETLIKYMKGKTTILFTHRLDVLNSVDYIGVLNDGVMVQFDTSSNVLNNPCSILKQILSQNAYEKIN